MTVSQRIDWAKRLTIVQLVINGAVVVIGMIAGASFLSAASGTGDSELFGIAVPAILAAFAGLLGIIIPLIVLYGLDRRTKEWGVAVYGLLLYQVLTGGGLMSIVPLVTLVFLFDRETFDELTGSEFRRTLVS